jgi:inosose dehydratase
MPELGAGTSWQAILEDAAAIGFAGVELGGGFPQDAERLRTGFAERGLAVVGQWYGCALLDRPLAAEIAMLAPQLARLESVGASTLIVAEVSNAIHGQRLSPLSATPGMADGDWARWGERLTGLADHVASRGLTLAYHPHLGTIVERDADLAHLIDATGPSVRLTLDTGHAALAGIDVVAVTRAHRSRIAHIHCKDIRPAAFDGLRARNGSFLDGVLDGIFTTPGDGALDFSTLMRALAANGYDGWIVIEAEQDPRVADPRMHAAQGLAPMRAAARAAGLVESRA